MSVDSLVTNKVCADCEHREVCHHKAIIQAIYEHFNVPIDIPEVKEKLDEAEDSYQYFMKKNFGIDESESEDRPDFLKKSFNIPMAKEDE